jgi:N-acetyltransferase
MAPEKWDENFDWMLSEQEAGRWLLHTVRDGDGQIVGQTCYLAMRPEHKGVEIGGTWYAPSVHGTKVNPACKLMLLEHAFACGAGRVELKTNANNARSRAAILKMGAQFEGVHRRHILLYDGSWRDTAWFSVIAEEWPDVKARLEARLA